MERGKKKINEKIAKSGPKKSEPAKISCHFASHLVDRTQRSFCATADRQMSSPEPEQRANYDDDVVDVMCACAEAK